VHLIQEKAVQRGLERRVAGELKHLGVDEKSFLKGHQYATILSDLDNPRVLDVARDRKEDSLGELLNKLPEAQRDNIKAVAMDMWEPFINAVEQYLPQADIVHDKFHIAKYLGEAVDKVRRAENRNLVNQDKDTLKGTKYLWLTNPNNWSEQQEASFNELKDKGLKVGRAWSIKEMFSGLWDYRYEKAARRFFKRWFWWATHARLKPMAEVAKKLKRHLDNILTYLEHRITNAVAEGLNSKIQQIKSAARGFRKFENFRIAILFFCGKLDMYPQKSR
jgi:transposase